ncbi:MAG: hypothetical protein EZS28_041942, partial [Streblomastix strix]
MASVSVSVRCVGPVDYQPIGGCVEDIKVDRDTITHTEKNSNYSTVILDPVIKNGIVKIEIEGVNELSGL